MSTILVSLMSLSLDVDVPDVVVPDFVVPIVCVSDFNDSDVGPPRCHCPDEGVPDVGLISEFDPDVHCSSH